MKKSCFLTTLALLAVVEGLCQNYEKEYYTEIGCTAQDKDDQGCPTSYDCSMLKQRKQEKCYYQGQTVDDGQQIQNSPKEACVTDCKCLKNDGHRALFNCLRLECQGDFHVQPGCHKIYKHGTCCSVGKICVDPAKEKTHKDVCEFGGDTYQLGQKFYPEEHPCLYCICQAGFNGSLVEPFCQKIPCYIERLNGYRIAEGCIPVFYGDKSCCPIDWRCPESGDSVLPGVKKEKPTSSSGKSCQFGNLTMNIGDKLSPSKEFGPFLEWECTCRVPPYPVCIQKANSPS